MEENANKKHWILQLAKKYWTAAKQFLYRSVILFFIFIVLAGFFSSVFTAAAISILSALATSAGKSFFATLIFFGIEFLFVFCALLVFYGVFLCNLRFVRNQPVALSFLFVGFRQSRAKTMSIFFSAFFVALFFLTIIPATGKFVSSLPQFTELQPLLDYLAENPETMKRFSRSMLIFVVAVIALFLPFAFTPFFVYDESENNFRNTLGASLKFFGKNAFRFLGFEIAANFPIAVVLALLYAARNFIGRIDGANNAMQWASSLLAFAQFSCSLFFYSNIILSAGFYYNEIRFDKIQTAKENSPPAAPTNQNENPQSDRQD